VADFEICRKIYGAKTDYYGTFTKCPNCGVCLYTEEVSKYNEKFDDSHAEEAE